MTSNTKSFALWALRAKLQDYKLSLHCRCQQACIDRTNKLEETEQQIEQAIKEIELWNTQSNKD